METNIERPADSAGELYHKTPVTPEEAFQAIGRLRKDARDEIDRLIRFLDKTDDYMSRELEDEVDAGPCDDNELELSEGDDEPDLGFLEPHTIGDFLGRTPWVSRSFNQARQQGGNASFENEGDDSDDEPSLGGVATNEWSDQRQWAIPGTSDLEDEHDGTEPPEDDEPSLGWTTSGVLADGLQCGNDREQDSSESGIGDHDGLLEQVGEIGWQAGRDGMV